MAGAIPDSVWAIARLPFLLIGSLGALVLALGLASSANATLAADFSIEKPSTCVDGACVVIFRALGVDASDPNFHVITDPNDPNVLTRDSDSTVRPRKDLVYQWDFGNPNAGTHTKGWRAGTNKNVECCHSYWTPHLYQGGDTGTRTVTLRVSEPEERAG